MDLSLIIPCYNEEGNINAFFKKAEETFADRPIKYEYVFVNDGSSDKTGQILGELFEAHPDKNITVINFSRNFGKESALYAGLKNSRGTALCFIDADLQQSPSTALEMYNILVSSGDLDCVCAYQTNRNEGKMISKAKSLFYKMMNCVTETQIKNGASDFRVFTAQVKEAILSLGEFHRFSKGIFSWVGFKTEYIEYSAAERNSGETKWGFSKLLRYALSGIVSFSVAPLKIPIYTGIAAVIISVICFIAEIIKSAVSDVSVDNFALLAVLIAFFSGLILFSIGVIGEYLAKIYQQIKHRPIYIAKSILSRSDENKQSN